MTTHVLLSLAKRHIRRRNFATFPIQFNYFELTGVIIQEKNKFFHKIHILRTLIKLRTCAGCIRLSLWRNRLARSAVNRKVGGSSPPRDERILLR